MNMKLLAAGAVLAALTLPSAAQAQGVPGGAIDGYHKGDKIAGPIGAVIGAAVGGVVGGVVGGISGALGIPQGGTADESPPRRRQHPRGRHDDR